MPKASTTLNSWKSQKHTPKRPKNPRRLRVRLALHVDNAGSSMEGPINYFAGPQSSRGPHTSLAPISSKTITVPFCNESLGWSQTLRSLCTWLFQSRFSSMNPRGILGTSYIWPSFVRPHQASTMPLESHQSLLKSCN